MHPKKNTKIFSTTYYLVRRYEKNTGVLVCVYYTYYLILLLVPLVLSDSSPTKYSYSLALGAREDDVGIPPYWFVLNLAYAGEVVFKKKIESRASVAKMISVRPRCFFFSRNNISFICKKRNKNKKLMGLFVMKSFIQWICACSLFPSFLHSLIRLCNYYYYYCHYEYRALLCVILFCFRVLLAL